MSRPAPEMISVVTEHPVALDSPDHLHPWGTKHDNHINEAFNRKLLRLIPGASVLDLGCSGGGFVKTLVDAGNLAVGIEGSDFSQKIGRAEWRHLDETHLFTADITKPFTVLLDGEIARFDVVTLWEVIEHIAEYDLDAVFENIAAHLLPGGVVIMSISTGQDTGSGFPLHQTVQPEAWWMEWLGRKGWANAPEVVAYFGQDMVRNASGSFHVVLVRRGELI